MSHSRNPLRVCPMNCHEFSNDLDLWKFQIFIIIKIRRNEIIRFRTKNQKICVTTYIFFRLRHPKHEKRWRRAKRVPKSFTAMDGIEQGHRRGSSIRCLRGEVRRVTSAFIHTTSCARARALAPTFTSSLLSYADIYICNIYMYYIDTHTQVNTGHQRSLLSPTFLQRLLVRFLEYLHVLLLLICSSIRFLDHTSESSPPRGQQKLVTLLRTTRID